MYVRLKPNKHNKYKAKGRNICRNAKPTTPGLPSQHIQTH